jgi:hypothetical protein
LVALAAIAITGGLFVPRATDGDRALTPAGWLPRDLVHEISDGQALREIDGVIRVVDARTDAPIDADPEATLLSVEPLDLEAGWITFTYWKNQGAPLTSFSTEWRVPEAPSTKSRQTIFLFNGLQNSGPNYGILQPVLQWGRSYAGGGDYWSVASWYVTSRGQAFHTPLQRVKPGDRLVGEMVLVGEERGRRSYTCEITNVPRTRLLLQNVATLDWSTESLEAYGVKRCSDYPRSPGVPFTAIQLRTGGVPAMEWTAVDRVTDCDQHAEIVSHSATDGRVDLFFSDKR